MSLERIVQRFKQVDQYIAEVYEELTEQMDQPVSTDNPWRDENELQRI
ncbi:hypothetical protein [Fictibacillus nanhaiensis]